MNRFGVGAAYRREVVAPAIKKLIRGRTFGTWIDLGARSGHATEQIMEIWGRGVPEVVLVDRYCEGNSGGGYVYCAPQKIRDHTVRTINLREIMMPFDHPSHLRDLRERLAALPRPWFVTNIMTNLRGIRQLEGAIQSCFAPRDALCSVVFDDEYLSGKPEQYREAVEWTRSDVWRGAHGDVEREWRGLKLRRNTPSRELFKRLMKEYYFNQMLKWPSSWLTLETKI